MSDLSPATQKISTVTSSMHDLSGPGVITKQIRNASIMQSKQTSTQENSKLFFISSFYCTPPFAPLSASNNHSLRLHVSKQPLAANFDEPASSKVNDHSSCQLELELRAGVRIRVKIYIGEYSRDSPSQQSATTCSARA